MKKSLACITAVVILIFLVSCSEETPIDPYASLPQLQNVEYSISSEVIDVAIDDNEFILYLLYNDRITAFDLAKGSEELYCETDDNDLISTANNKIYTYSGKDDLIRIFDNNELTKEIKCNFNASELRRIYVHGNHFLLETMDGGKYNPESNIYYADLESGENHIIDPKKFKKSDTVIINSIGFEDDDTVIILASTNQSLTNTVKKIIRFNIVSQKLIEKKKIDCITNIREYYPWDKCFYGEDNCQISLYSPENDETTNLGFRHDYEYKGKLNIGNSVYTSRMMIAGTNAIIWDGYIDHKIVVTNFSEKDPVVINLPMNFFDHKLVAERYKEKFGGNVHFTIYQNFESDKDLELYYDKVRLSLLAKDSEVDIFFISNQSDMYFLDSLLNNGAYTPLEDYEAIDKGFDNLMSGVRDIMSYEGHIYAVPLNIELYWNSVKTDYAKELGFDKFDRSSLTYDDIWTACEKLRAFDTDKISLFYNARLDEFLIPFVQNAIDSGELNEAELTELLTNIKKYYDEGLLFREYAEGASYNTESEGISLFDTAIYYGSINNFISGGDVPSYPESGIALAPTYNGTVYQTPVQYAIINPNSDNKEEAAKFLSLLLSEEFIYELREPYTLPMGKDLEKYPFYDTLGDDAIEYLEALEFILENSKPLTYNIDAFTYQINRGGISDRFFSGEITPAEAAKEICDYIGYTYFE